MDRFRQDVASQIKLPSADQIAGGKRLACLVEGLLERLRAGATIHVTTDAAGQAMLKDEIAPNTGAQKLICETAGSTGAPKAIQRAPNSWIASFEITSSFGPGAETPYAVLGTFNHSLSLYAVLEALHLDAALSVLTGMSARAQCEAMRDAGTKVLYATPTQLRVLATARAKPLGELRYVFCGGGSLDSATRGAARALFPRAEMREFYGTTETSFVAISDRGTPAGSVGRAYPGVEISLRDAAGREVEDQGALWVRSPYLFGGYVGGYPKATLSPDGFVNTGEIGSIDPEGHIFLLGRSDRMVTISDRNVFPELVETHLLSHPVVAKAAVVAVPDALRGHALIAFVEAMAGDVSEAALSSYCRERLGAGMSPKFVRIVERLPILASGKPDLRALHERAEAFI